MIGVSKTTMPVESHWLFVPEPNPEARMRLFCFPYAGGGAVIFRKWPNLLPGEIEVCAVELPGHGTRLKEPLYTKMEPLVEAIARGLLPFLNLPFAFYGHSMGAMVSFEVCRYLRRERGPEPVHLFVSGRRAPHIPDTDPPTYNLPEQELIEDLRRLSGTPEEILENPEILQFILPIIRADFSVCQTRVYEDGPPLNTPISVIGGLQDEDATPDLLEPWRDQTTGKFSSRMLPGDHFFINTHQALLLEILSRELAGICKRRGATS